MGGAVGDALGAPIEFWSTEQIRVAAGPRGVRDFQIASFSGAKGVGLVTDDTQMTLFTVEGLIRMLTRERTKGIGRTVAVVDRAYRRWLDTQDQSGPNPGDGWLATQAWLYSRRAPGNTCLSALRAPRDLGEPARNDSKGCGGVMRSAPFGFLPLEHEEIYALACEAASYTHGHPTGQHASGALALIVHALADGSGLFEAVALTMAFLSEQPGTDETLTSLAAAVALARDDSVREPGTIERLGQGWIAEEALAMATFAALVHSAPGQCRDALAVAVSHGGDSDSTGAICGNILGAAHGLAAIPADLAFRVEGRGTILELADDFWYEIIGGQTPWDSWPVIIGSSVASAGDPGLHDQTAWFERYPPD